jgi:branched-chain amino acid aminotransferase
MQIPVSKDEMQEIVLETLRRNNLTDAYFRLVVTRGPETWALTAQCPKPFVFCIAASMSFILTSCMKRHVGHFRVYAPNIPTACIPRVKSLNYLNNIYAKMEANLPACRGNHAE